MTVCQACWSLSGNQVISAAAAKSIGVTATEPGWRAARAKCFKGHPVASAPDMGCGGVPVGLDTTCETCPFAFVQQRVGSAFAGAAELAKPALLPGR